jgi:ABC-type glycerol-3-phosphate transport system substrate-binding protein
MKSTPSTFQLVVATIFLLMGIIGVVFFAGFGGSNSAKIPTATIWGIIPATQFDELVRQINIEKIVVNVTYVQKAPERFREEFINALAEEKGPDIVLITDDLMYAERGKLMLIPYTSLPQRDYADTYINAADQFMNGAGISGIPFTVDPIVMYYNRDMLTTAGIAEPPKLWKDLDLIVPKIAVINETKGIQKAAVALGEARNVNNAKEIIASMLLQAGNPITSFDPVTQLFGAVIDAPGEEIASPGDAVLKFYTTFSNPLNPLYTWSRSMPNSKQAFLLGDLAIYFGYASEFTALRLENPNLNFDVAPIPQNSPSFSATYGRVTAFAITKRPRDAVQAFAVISTLTSPSAQKTWVDISKMPPVRKDLLNEVPGDKFLSAFYRAAIQTRTWVDPDPIYSAVIFRDMVESVTTGQSLPVDALNTAKQRLELLLQGIKS